MADIAGAKLAIKARLEANWTTTPIAYQNGADVTKQDANGNPTPWVYCEVIGTGSELRGIGAPGNHVYTYFGLINLHVFVPIGSGDDLAEQYAVTLGEIFRGAGFYSDGTGNFLRTWSPHTDGGDSGSDDGLWWRVTTVVQYEFFYHG